MLALLALLALLLAGAAAAAVPPYTITDLGALGGSSSHARGINQAGHIVGWWYPEERGRPRGFLYADGVMRDIGPPGSRSTTANAINDRGQIVGDTDAVPLNGYLLDPTGVRPLGALGGRGSRAAGINNAGQVVGTAFLETHRAFLWTAGTMLDLGTLGGATSEANGINNLGQVVGLAARRPGLASHAFLWQSGVMHDLGTLGGSYSVAFAINDAGQVVGQAAIAGDRAYHAFLFDPSGKQDLGTLGGMNSVAHAINRAGWVVGSAYTPTNTLDSSHAFLFAEGRMWDLNLLIPAGSGWVLDDAFGINDRNEIVGHGFHHGARRAFLLTPHATTVSDLAVAAVAPASARLTWSDTGDRAARVELSRRAGTGDWLSLGLTPAGVHHFTDSGLLPQTRYEYRGRIDRPGSDWSAPVTLLTSGPPVAPSRLVAHRISPTRVRLSWIDRSDNETAFAVWRRSGAGEWMRIGAVPADAVKFEDGGLTGDVPTLYRVRATNNYAASDWSNEAIVPAS